MHKSCRVSVYVRVCVGGAAGAYGYKYILMRTNYSMKKNSSTNKGGWQILIDDKREREGFSDGEEKLVFFKVCHKQMSSALVRSEVNKQEYCFPKFFSSGKST